MAFSEFMATIARVATAFQGAPPDAHARVWSELRPWFTTLLENATGKWLQRLAVGVTCEVPHMQRGRVSGRCPGAAIAVCQACGKSCCLNHARIDSQGEAICFLCCVELIELKHKERAVAAQRAPGEDPAWASKVLGVKNGAPWAKVKAAYKKESAAWHPDKYMQSNIFDRTNAEQKFKDVQRAFDVLKSEYPGES